MRHPKDIGDTTTLAVMLLLREAGYGIFVPFGENTRCDLIIDEGGLLRRVQCKTGRLRRGAVRWSVCSNYYHHPHPRSTSRDYVGEIDYFGVFCPETGGVYLIPIDALEVRCTGSLRVEPTRNGQKRRIRHAAVFEIGRVSVSSGRVNEVVAGDGHDRGQLVL